MNALQQKRHDEPLHLKQQASENPFVITKKQDVAQQAKEPLSQTYKHAKPELAAPQPRAFSLFVHRPLMTWAICMISCIVAGIIVMVPSLASEYGLYDFGQTVMNEPFAQAGTALFFYCIPATVGIVVVIMANLYVSRTVRIVMASISYVAIVLVFWFAIATCFLPVAEHIHARLLELFTMINDRAWWAIMLLGFLFGMSLPVSERAQREQALHPATRSARRSLRIVYAAWFVLVGIATCLVLFVFIGHG